VSLVSTRPGALAGVGARSDDRCDVHDAAEAGAQHRAERPAGRPKGGGEVGVDDPLPGIVAELRREAVVADAGVVDENEHAAVLLFEGGEDGVERAGVADVALHERGGASLAGDLPRDRFGAVGVGAVVDGDGPAVLGEAPGNGSADTARAAGDEGAALGAAVRGLSTHRGPPIR
jgi:hypothetical protein